MMLSMFGAAFAVAAGLAELKSPAVPFGTKSAKREAAQPTVGDNVISFGDRRIFLDPNQIRYSADGAERFRLWHDFSRQADGKTVYLRADEAACETTARGIAMTTRLFAGDREVGRIRKTARLTADGSLVVSFRPQCPKDCTPRYNLRLGTTWMRGQTLAYNGTVVTLANDMPGYLKFRAPACASPFTRFDCATNVAAVGFTLMMSGVKAQHSRTSANDFDMRLLPVRDDAEIVFTFRPVACDRRANDCVLGGINFTAEDNVRVYSASRGKNAVLDPSFESKMRFHTTRIKKPVYRLENGKLTSNDPAGLRDSCVNGTMAHTGRYSLQPARGNWLVLKSLPLVAGETYVFSCWVRSLDGRPANVSVTHRSGGIFNQVSFPRRKDADWSKWTRIVSKPFKALSFGDHFAVGGSENLVLDDVQIERGTEATAFAAGELGFEMVTGSPEGTICDATKNHLPRVRVSGDTTLKGTLRLTGRDFFDRQIFDIRTPLSLGADAETFVALPETKSYPRGPVFVRVAFAPKGSDAFTYRDTVRLFNIDYAPAESKWRNLFNSLAHSHYKHTREQLSALGLINRSPEYWLDSEADAVRLLPDERLVSWQLHRVDLTSGPDWKWYIGDLPFRDASGRCLTKAETYPDDFLKKVEASVAKYVAARPWNDHWIYSSEPSGHHRSIQVGRYDEYAKLVAAVGRGVKRGNPKALFVPVGHCSHADEGMTVSIPTLKAAKKVAPDLHFDACGAHCYCEHPEVPDLDKTIAGLIGNLTDIGYGGMKFTFEEGGYFVSQRVDAYKFAPWAPTYNKDMAGGECRFSNDAGWAEHVAAAMQMRYYVMMFKYADRILQLKPWVYAGESEFYSWTAMISVFHRMLGDATFVDNFEFASAARVYFYKDGHGRFIAIPWLFSRELDYGRAEGQRMYLPATGLGVELTDLMGNRCSARERNGALDLPLDNYPYYISVPEKNAQKLIDSFKRVEYTPKADSIPYGLEARPLSATEFSVDITNPFASEKRLTVRIGDGAAEEIVLARGVTKTLKARFPTASADGCVNDFVIPIAVTWNGFTSRESLLLRTWNVSRVGRGDVDWSKVPAVRLAGTMPQGWRGPDDFSAVCRLAWRDGELLVRTEAKDDVFVPSPAGQEKGWSWFFESTQLFFDAFGNGRANLRNGINGFDADDFLYDVFAVARDRAKVYRNRVPDQQLTFGLQSPPAGTYAEMPCVFEAKEGRRSLTLTLTDYDVAPAKIGMARPMAFAVMVHDIDDAKAECDREKRVFGKATVCSVAPDEAAFGNPHHYAWLIFQPPAVK